MLSILKKYLPLALYSFLYKTFFKVKQVNLHKVTDIPYEKILKNESFNLSGSVRFVANNFINSKDVQTESIKQFCIAFKDITYFSVASNNSNVTNYFVYPNDKQNFNLACMKLINIGYKFSIAGKVYTKARLDFFKLAVSKKSNLVIYREIVSAQGTSLFGDNVSLIINILNHKNHERLKPLASNSYFSEILVKELEHLEELQRKFTNDEYSFEVDVVYTWVDGDDPAWIKRKNKYSPEKIELPTSSNVDCRYKSRGELKYSIRSIMMYAPWVRNIYVVTNEQVPEWLDENDKVKIIDHSDIFEDVNVLPVFNSHAIESNLHRIPNLSEHFLYFNDDFFIRAPISKSHFYTAFGRQTKFFYSNKNFIPLSIEKDALPVDIAAFNNSRLLAVRYNYHPIRKFQHTPMAMKKSSIKALESTFPEIFKTNSKAKFRSFTDYSIISALIHHYSYYKGTAIESVINYTYIDLIEEKAELRLERLIHNDRKIKCYCINDVETDISIETMFFDDLMSKMYPYKCLAEK